jgi:hypothetical protein
VGVFPSRDTEKATAPYPPPWAIGHVIVVAESTVPYVKELPKLHLTFPVLVNLAKFVPVTVTFPAW